MGWGIVVTVEVMTGSSEEWGWADCAWEVRHGCVVWGWWDGFGSGRYLRLRSNEIYFWIVLINQWINQETIFCIYYFNIFFLLVLSPIIHQPFSYTLNIFYQDYIYTDNTIQYTDNTIQYAYNTIQYKLCRLSFDKLILFFPNWEFNPHHLCHQLYFLLSNLNRNQPMNTLFSKSAWPELIGRKAT